MYTEQIEKHFFLNIFRFDESQIVSVKNKLNVRCTAYSFMLII